MEGNECLQELGLTGRLRRQRAVRVAIAGHDGALDLYEVAGGYATTTRTASRSGCSAACSRAARRGIAWPAGHRSGLVPISLSNFFQDNTRPDTNQAFDVGIGCTNRSSTSSRTPATTAACSV